MKKIERVQTGLRIEKRLLKVLKGLAEHLDISVAELIEAMGSVIPVDAETFDGEVSAWRYLDAEAVAA